MGIKEYFDLFERIVKDIDSRRMSTDRARQTVFGTTVGHLEHFVRRIRGNITRIRCWLYLHDFFHAFFDDFTDADNFSKKKLRIKISPRSSDII